MKNSAAEFWSRFFSFPWAKPQGSDLMITNACNFRCSHCNIWQQSNGQELDLTNWQKIIFDLRQWLGPNYFLSVGGGEPLLKKDILTILEVLVKNDFRVTLVTNGYLIDEIMAQKIVSLGIEGIRISLYSFEPQLHNEMRGVADAHQRAKQALEWLATAKKKQNSQLKITVAILVNEKNISQDALNLIDWAQANDFNILIQALDENFKAETTNQSWPENNPFWPKDQKKINEFFDQLLKLKKQGVKIENSYKILNAFRQYFLKPRESVKIPCVLGYRSMNIDPAGKLFFCFACGATLETLVDNSARKLWRSGQMQELRKKVKSCSRVCRIRCYYRDNLLDKIKLQIYK